MSVDIAGSTTSGTSLLSRRARRRQDRHERSRLAQQDALGVRLLELHGIRALLEETHTLINVGWIQNAWYKVLDEQGREQALTVRDVHLTDERPVTGVCLVGGIVFAGGGPAAAHSQLVQRTLDLTWHALHEDVGQPVRWCPSPMVRTAHVRDLTRWNDHPQRTSRQVSELLESAIGITHAEIELRREQQSRLATA